MSETFCCPVHGYYTPLEGVTLAICPTCQLQGLPTVRCADGHPVRFEDVARAGGRLKSCGCPDAPRRFDDLAAEAHQWALAQGFYFRQRLPGWADGGVENPSLPAERLLRIAGKAAETMEALRHGDRATEAEELADLVIRCLDYAAWRGISLDDEVERKMEVNRDRPHLHGRQF